MKQNLLTKTYFQLLFLIGSEIRQCYGVVHSESFDEYTIVWHLNESWKNSSNERSALFLTYYSAMQCHDLTIFFLFNLLQISSKVPWFDEFFLTCLQLWKSKFSQNYHCTCSPAIPQLEFEKYFSRTITRDPNYQIKHSYVNTFGGSQNLKKNLQSYSGQVWKKKLNS